MTEHAAATRIEFADFALTLAPLKLERAGRAVDLRNRALKLIALFVERPGELISHEEISQALWGERQVDFARGIHVCIGEIRHALMDDADNPKYIETLPRQGYRFICPVKTVSAQSKSPARNTLGGAILRHSAKILVSVLVVVLIGAYFLKDFTPETVQNTGPNLSLAEEAYKKGVHLLEIGGLENYSKSEQFFAEAVGRDATFAPAHLALANVAIFLGEFDKAKIHADKALKLSPNNAEAYLHRARIALWGDWNWAEAENFVSQSIAIDPTIAKAHMIRALLYLVQGRTDDAPVAANIAYKLDPVSSLVNTGYGVVLFHSGNYLASLKFCSDASELYPSEISFAFCQFQSATRIGNQDAACAAAARILQLYEAEPELALNLVNAPSEKHLAQFLSWYGDNATQSIGEDSARKIDMAVIFAEASDFDSALDALESGFELHDPLLPLYMRNPAFEPLHSDQRYNDILAKIGMQGLQSTSEANR